ncbi:MAG: hypothetical protein E7046_01710 [Lentisphaerae bacterium]|nr:hypothetical protein [Lentisphaerota bacterium]
MKTSFMDFVGRGAIVTVVMALPFALCADVGDVLASSSKSPAFSLYTTDGTTYSAVSAEEIAALPPVVWREGDTVTQTSPAGVVTVLASDATTAGSASLASLAAGGIYELTDSVWGSAKLCIPYTLFGEVGDTIVATDTPLYGFRIDSRQEGPDRRTFVSDVPPVAYSGDEWGGDAAKTATLTIVQPSGEATELALEGTGVTPFKFSSGAYTVTLSADGSPTRTAKINVTGGLTVIIF